jgi:ABC-type amino acid transport substrate-binding protein
MARLAWTRLLLVALLCSAMATFGSAYAQTPDDTPATLKPQQYVRVATKPFKPFVFKQNDAWVGFSIDLWRELAKELNWNFDLYGTNSVPELLGEVQNGNADIAIAGITINSTREAGVDFSYAFFQSGLQIAVPISGEVTAGEIIFSFISPELLKLIGFLFLVLLAAAHVVWIIERRTNPDFPRDYFNGIWAAFWWASVTMTTVGYGDKIPRARLGRAVALVWMFSGIILIAYFSASVTTVLTVQQLHGSISGVNDLAGKEVGTVSGTTAHSWLTENSIEVVEFANIEETLDALAALELDAVVYDSPALLYHAAHEGRGTMRVVGPVFAKQAYGIAMPEESPHLEDVNRALLTIQENGVYGDIYVKWFGG